MKITKSDRGFEFLKHETYLAPGEEVRLQAAVRSFFLLQLDLVADTASEGATHVDA